MEGRRGLRLLLPMATCIFAATFLFPCGEGLPRAARKHQFVYDAERSGHEPGAPRRARRKSGRGRALDSWACGTVTAVPQAIRSDFPLDDFYQKYTHAYGIPVVSSSSAQDGALTRACYTVRFLLADRRDLRDAMYDWYGRVGVIAATERTTQIPEHSNRDSSLDDRTPGLGGIPDTPVTTDAEENILCGTGLEDPWFEEDILVHEFAHAIHLISLADVDESFQAALQDSYDLAKQRDLWADTYAISKATEYWAEGVQAFFNVQVCRGFTDYVHNHICTRDLLKGYDRPLYDLVASVFPCMNDIVDRCDEDQSLAANQVLAMNCNLTEDTTVTPATHSPFTDVMGPTDVASNTTETVLTTSGTRYTRSDAVIICTLLIIEGIVIG